MPPLLSRPAAAPKPCLRRPAVAPKPCLSRPAAAPKPCPACDQLPDDRGRLHKPNSSACKKVQRRNGRAGKVARKDSEYSRQQRQVHRGAEVYQTKEAGECARLKALASTRLSFQDGSCWASHISGHKGLQGL